MDGAGSRGAVALLYLAQISVMVVETLVLEVVEEVMVA
jgi:hypothetical protein